MAEEPDPDEIRIVHTSDVHVDDDFVAQRHGGEGARWLSAAVEAAVRLNAHILLLVGDTFDHNRLPSRVVERAADILRACPAHVVILPGNHDPATEDSVFRHPAFVDLPGVRVLGVGCGETAHFPNLSLEIWGRPHVDYDDMEPLAAPAPRRSRRRIVLAHGHYEPDPDFRVRPRPSWLFGDAHLSAADADYIALGHWNRAVEVGAGPTPAWYSGSPDIAGSVNLIRLRADDVVVTREAVDF